MKLKWLGALGMAATVLLSACGGETAAPTPTANPTATQGATSGSTPATSQPSAAVAAPTNTTIVVGDPKANLLINGAGATFPAPIYTKWFAEYSANVEKGVRFNYQPI